MMLGGGGKNKHPLELLADPERFKAHVEQLNAANEARNISAENYRKAKAEALAAIDQSEEIRLIHEERERQLNVKNDEVEGLKSYFNTQIANYNQKLAEFSREKADFEVERAKFQESIAKTANEHAARDQGFLLRKNELDVRESELEKRMGLLMQREGWIADAETEIRNFAYKLSRSDRL